MSEWIRNRGSKSMPKRLNGFDFEVRLRNGEVMKGSKSIDFDHEYTGTDVMAYRIVKQEPHTPDYTNGYPENTTAANIGAKVGDEFVVAAHGQGFDCGNVVSLLEDDETTCPYFTDGKNNGYMYWHELAPVPPKSAIELQAEEVGIPEPVKEWPEDRIDVVGQNGNDGLHYGIDTSPERVEIEKEIEHEDDAPIGKRVADAMFAEIMKLQPSEHLEDDIQRAADNVKWESVFGLRDIIDAARKVGVEIKFESVAPTTAPAFLQSALQTLTQRGKDYDKPDGERSAASVSVAFNAITGRNLTEAEVWLILQLVKDVRQWQNPGRYHADSALDCVAYAALKAEALAKGGE